MLVYHHSISLFYYPKVTTTFSWVCPRVTFSSLSISLVNCCDNSYAMDFTNNLFSNIFSDSSKITLKNSEYTFENCYEIVSGILTIFQWIPFRIKNSNNSRKLLQVLLCRNFTEYSSTAIRIFSDNFVTICFKKKTLNIASHNLSGARIWTSLWFFEVCCMPRRLRKFSPDFSMILLEFRQELVEYFFKEFF